jgi:integrase
MAKVTLAYVNSFRDRYGRPRYYFRKGGKRVPLPGVPGTAVFAEAYEEQLAELAPHVLVRRGRLAKLSEGTLAWVIDEYKKSPTWLSCKPSTQEVYNRRFDWLKERYGTAELRTFTEDGVRKIRNKLRDHPSVADAVVDRIGMLWAFAKEHLEMKLGSNPAREVASLHTEHKPHKAWPEELCRAFEALPNPRLVRAYFLLRYTGQRRSDVVRMRASMFDGTAIEVVQEKTGTYVWVPCHRRLREHLTATGIGEEYLLSTTWGTPFRATSLTNIICTACKELGFAGYSPHGLRHLAGSALAESGCTMDEIMSILGHLTEDEAREYVRQARRKVMARSAMNKWEANS